jgi:hypothetical protein
MHDGGHRQFLNATVGELDHAAGSIREPQVLLVSPVSLRRHHVAQEGVERFLGGRCGHRFVKLESSSIEQWQ